jgi:hypothetical protein
MFRSGEVERENRGGQQSADDEECGDEGKGPAFSRKSVGDVVNVFWERTEEKGLEDSDDMDCIQSRGEWQEQSEQRVRFEGSMEEQIFRAKIEGPG